MRKVIRGAGVTICTVLLATTTIFAQDAADPEEPTDKQYNRHCVQAKRLLNVLKRGLSEVQQEALLNELADYRDNVQEIAPDLREARHDMFRTINDPDLNEDEELVRATHQELSSIREEIAVYRANFMAALYPEVLDEQEYSQLVRFKFHAYQCFLAPKKNARRRLNRIIDNR